MMEISSLQKDELTFITEVAFVLLHTYMSSLMFQLVGVALKLSVAELAVESLNALVLILVHFKSCSRSKCLRTFIALEGSDIAMNILMGRKLMLRTIG